MDVAADASRPFLRVVQQVVMTLILRVFVRSSCKILWGATLMVDPETIRRAIGKEILRAAKAIVATRPTILHTKVVMWEMQDESLEAVLGTVWRIAHDKR